MIAAESRRRAGSSLAVFLFAAVIFVGCIASPPALMDDVDAVHAQIARNMLTSGDWTIAHLDGVPYLEKSPLLYWLIAICFRVLGVHDWVARIPVALGAILLCLVTARFGRWAFGEPGGFYAGLSLATCAGLFLFTRIQIPDVLLTLCVCVAMWSFLRALEEDEPHPRRWAALLAASLGTGVLFKGLIALVAPVGGALVYLTFTRQLMSGKAWRRLRPVSGTLILLAIAAPWHILATLRMPPYVDFTMHSGPGEYHGFFWFYFINEHVLRFLNLRYPRDYNTVPCPAFWLLHLLWLFPWSVYFPSAAALRYKPVDRAGRARLLALCWTGFLLLFFTFSTTQEYYSMPVYPALALLLGSAMAIESKWLRIGSRTLGIVCGAAALAIATILFLVRGVPTPGDIASALQQHPDSYTLSLGHLGDLTMKSLAYLRWPLVLAGLACLVGVVGAWRFSGRRAFLAFAVMMTLFLYGARAALVVFDPYLSSRTLAETLQEQPEGRLIVDGTYYPFSSVLFYAERSALLLNGRKYNLEYGSYAPGAPAVFLDDSEFARLWLSPVRYYLVSDATQVSRLERLVGGARLGRVLESGGKILFTNSPTSSKADLSGSRNSRSMP
jgi:4-amino-4-deoxy-L-arabinose transferase-like glycosyltransferase